MALRIRPNDQYGGGAAMGGGIFSRGHRATTIAGQAQTTYNTRVDEGLFETRQSKASRLPTESVIGPITNPSQVMILEGSLMFSMRDEMVYRAANDDHERKPTVFASFTGMKIPNSVRDDESMANSVMFMGVSVNQYNSNDLYQTKDGVALAMSGSITLHNTGNRNIFPRQALRWSTPSINPKKRERDAQNSKLPGHRAIVEPFTFHERTRWPQTSIEWLLNTATASHVSFLDMDRPDTTGVIPNVSVKQRVSTGFAQHSIHSGLAMLQVLEAYGLVTLNVPMAWQDPMVYQRVLKGIDSNPIDTVNNKDVTWDAEGNISVTPMSDVARVNVRMKRLFDIGFLLSLLGYSNRGISRSIMPSLEMVRAVTGRSLWGLMSNPADKQKYDVVSYYGDRGITRNIDGRSILLSDTVLETIKRIRNDMPSDFMRALSLQFHQDRERIIGTSIYYSSPNTTLDALLYA